MSHEFKCVGEFHKKFGLNYAHENPGKPRLLHEDELVRFRLRFLHEELRELEDGYLEADLAKIADALVDLVYVALGTAHLHNLPWDDLWNEVQRANMAKQRAERAEDSKRGSKYDVVKPEGWQPPRVHETLLAAGWPGHPLPL